jgi:hypothetical protein
MGALVAGVDAQAACSRTRSWAMVWRSKVSGWLGILLIGGMVWSACDQSQPLAVQSTSSTSTAASSTAATQHQEPTDHGHDHAHVAPHGGTLVVFGEEAAHLELVIDAQNGAIKGYVLDGCAEEGVRIAQLALVIEVDRGAGQRATLELQAQSDGLTGERPGDTSVFAGRYDSLVGLDQARSVLRAVTIQGQTYENVAFTLTRPR